MPDDDLAALVRAQGPHARQAVRAAAAALLRGDPDAATRAIGAYLDRNLPQIELAARIDAYVTAGLELCAQRMRAELDSRPPCGHPGCGPAIAAINPAAEAGPAQRAVALAVSELANGDRPAARDVLDAFTAAAADGTHDLVDIPIAVSGLLRELYGGGSIEHLDVYVGDVVGPQLRGDHDNDH